MSLRPIIDAGPGINFFSVHKERLLFSVLGPLCVPETVEAEILRKARQEQRFAAAERVWKKLPDRLVGSIGLVHTVTVLERAAGGEHLRDRDTMRNLYARLRKLDDGLPPLDTTNLMSLPCW